MVFQHTVAFRCPNQPDQRDVKLEKISGTYEESGEAKVAHLNVEIFVNENIMTLDISMNDA